MADDDRRDEAILAETLAGFGPRPVLDGAAEPGEPDDTRPDWQPDEEPGGPDESRLDRLAAGLRWAAAPLGFFLFLAALTAYGVLRDRAGDTADSPSPAPAATTEMPSTTAPPPTTEPPAAVTTVPTTAPPVPTTASAPAVVPVTTVPPVGSA
ncbi:MAG TPA: hypothetical protein VG455_08455, partial [Acidimicrobiales bacterium]|nr:hypothetical protein [Acidimicrobiales bacterium]